jgi:class 3 adenylate cyclase/sensor domain CHASE-containing protein
MKLIPKTLLVTGTTAMLLLGGFYLIISETLLDNYRWLETSAMTRDLQRLTDAITYEAERVNEMAGDWSGWDDSHAFAQDGNEEFVTANLNGASLVAINIAAMLFFNQERQLVKAAAYRKEDGSPVEWDAKPLVDYLQARPRLLQHSELRGTIHGLAVLPEGMFMIASQPIVHSDYTGPIAGTLVFARFFDEAFSLALRQRLHLDFQILRMNEAQDQPQYQDILDSLQSRQRFLVRTLDENTLQGFILLKDIEKKPVLLLALTDRRAIYAQGLQAVNSLLYSMIAFGLVFIGVVLFVFEQAVMARMLRLADDVQRITGSGDTSGRVNMPGTDELSKLGREINLMLTALDEKGIALRVEKEKSEGLLHNMLPLPIAERMRQGEVMIAERFEHVSVMFADIVGFTELAQRIPPEQLVELLNQVFSAFDRLAEKYRLEKIKTIGDAYMVVAGAPEARADHAEAIALMALEINGELKRLSQQLHVPIAVRAGISSGEVVAGIIGKRKFSYDLWGDAVNTASRMESHGMPDRIHCTEALHRLLKDGFEFEERGMIEVKGKGMMRTYFLLGKKSLMMQS